MSDNSTGQGEPSRTLALLWGAPGSTPRKGPTRTISLAQVVDAAIAIADEEGLAALTIRAVANRVGVSPMSVYTYVRGKPELLDLMVDTCYLRMERPAWGRHRWRRRLTMVAEQNRDLLTTHPWLTEVAALSRPPLGPGLMAKYEHELAALDHTGLSDVDTDAALAHLLGFVQGHCRAAHDAARIRTDSALSDADWWAANAPVLAEAFNPQTYPRAVRIGAAAGETHGSAWSAEHAWEFGLTCTLEGLATLIEAD